MYIRLILLCNRDSGRKSSMVRRTKYPKVEEILIISYFIGFQKMGAGIKKGTLSEISQHLTDTHHSLFCRLPKAWSWYQERCDDKQVHENDSNYWL